VPADVGHFVARLAPHADGLLGVADQLLQRRAQGFYVGRYTQAADAGLHKFVDAAGVGGGEDRLGRAHRLDGDQAEVFVVGEEGDEQRIGVLADDFAVGHPAQKADAGVARRQGFEVFRLGAAAGDA